MSLTIIIGTVRSYHPFPFLSPTKKLLDFFYICLCVCVVVVCVYSSILYTASCVRPNTSRHLRTCESINVQHLKVKEEVSDMSKPVVIKAKLKFKGSGGTSSAVGSGILKKRPLEADAKTVDAPNKSADKAEGTNSSTGKSTAVQAHEPDYLTDAQRKHQRRMIEHEAKEAKKLVKTSYRERVEQFNAKLSTLTEHNDIPRISAAGNG
jgi:protein FAM32A